MRRRRHAVIGTFGTGTLRAMLAALAGSPLSWLFVELAENIRDELLARDLPALAEQSGGYPCVAPEGVQ